MKVRNMIKFEAKERCIMFASWFIPILDKHWNKRYVNIRLAKHRGKRCVAYKITLTEIRDVLI